MANDQWLGIELRHLAALERVVGQRLVERARGGGPLRLTETGELVLQHADAILARLKAAQADVAALAGGEARQLRVGITQSVGVRILPELMRRFVGDWPEVRLRPTEAPADLELYEAVERGDVDLSFVELPAPEGPFETTELMVDPYLLVVAADSPLAQRPISLADLSGVPLVGHTECRGLARIEAQLRSRGIEPEFAFRSDVNATIQALVGAGVGAAVLPALAVDPDDPLTVLRELPGIPPRILAIARHRDRHHSSAAQAFVDEAQAVCGGLSRARRLTAVGE